MNAEAERLIAALHLTPHPEGGYFRETYKSGERVMTARGESRSALTMILFLLTSDVFSAFHRLAADESWHFYRGDPLAIDIIAPAGRHERRVLGAAGPWQTVVPAGAYFASHVEQIDGYALVGCDVGPGFEYSDFFLPSRSALTLQFPQHATLISNLTRQL